MNDDRIRQICKDRLAMWTEDLVGDHATPLLLLGLGHDHKQGTISIHTNQEVKEDDMIAWIAMALDRLLDRRGKS